VSLNRASGQLEPFVSALIDTHVNYSFAIGGTPLVGPGAQVNVAFSPEGNVTQLLYSTHGLAAGTEMPVLPADMASEKCQELYGGPDSSPVKPTLAYYAPPLSTGANFVLPHFDCNAGALGQDGATPLQQLVPALDDPRFVPKLFLEAISPDGKSIAAELSVTGGRAPYSVQWTSSNADLSGVPTDQFSLNYAIGPRDGVFPSSETLKAVVTDANGIQVGESQVIPLVPGDIITAVIPAATDGASVDLGRTGQGLFAPAAVGGVTDFGIERAVSDMCSGNVSGYSARMDDEAFKRFHWTGQSAWERDFKQSADHDVMVDNVDETFYCGHGSGQGFTFESNKDDGNLTYLDPRISANGDWGDIDLEWLALLSCQVLKGTHNGLSWAQRWGPAFDGLHLLLGFQTNAYDWSNFGRRFADYQLGRSFGFVTITLPVRAAWFQAAAEEQPSGVQSVVMGVIGPGGLSNYNDYFWGQGPTGPDVREPSITGYWRVTMTNP
jgi:hypothetical protein